MSSPKKGKDKNCKTRRKIVKIINEGLEKKQAFNMESTYAAYMHSTLGSNDITGDASGNSTNSTNSSGDNLSIFKY